MSQYSHLRTVWRYRWRVLGLALLSALVVYGLSSTLLSKVYNASAQISVTIPQTGGNGPISQDTVLFYAQTFAQIGTTTPVIEQTVKQAGLGLDIRAARSRISVTASPTVGIITVVATGPRPTEATQLAKAMTTALIDAVNAQEQAATQAQLAPLQSQIDAVRGQLALAAPGSAAATAAQTQLQTLTVQLSQAQLQPTPRLNVVSPALGSDGAVSPHPKTYALLAFVTALVVFAELSALLSYLRDRFSKDELSDDVRRTLGLPLLARLPAGRGRPFAEAIRELRTSLLLTDGAYGHRSVAIVSMEQGVGRTEVAVSLAQSLAELGISTGLIDADHRNPAVHLRMGLSLDPGLTDVLRGRSLGSALTHSASFRSLAVLTAGTPVEDPGGTIGTHLTPDVLDAMTAQEIIIVDTPPLARFADALAIAPRCAATLVIVDDKRSTRRSTRQLLDQLDRVGAHPLGIVVNRRVRRRQPEAQPIAAEDRIVIPGHRAT